MNQGAANRRFGRNISWRSPVAITIYIAIVVNLILLAGWLWSRGGQTIDVTFEAVGSDFEVRLDGDDFVEAEFPSAPAIGGVILQMDSTEIIPSLPEPRGIDFIRVTDADSGDVLFEDDFSSPEATAANWTTMRGVIAVRDGHLRVLEGPGILTLNNANFADIRVDVRYANITNTSVSVRADYARDTRVVFDMRPFRHYDGRLALLVDGMQRNTQPVRVEADSVGVMKSMVATLLSFVPVIYLLIGIAFLAVFGLQFISHLTDRVPDRLRFRLPRAVERGIPIVIAAGIAMAAFGITLFLMLDYNAGIPHVPDEISYIYQAKALASGRFTGPLPPVADSFEWFNPSLMLVSDKGWTSIYPFGHPVPLAIGELFGVIWIVPPIIGALAVFATFFAGRAIWNTRTGLLAALILAASPFFLMTASNFMSHNTAVLYIAGSLAFLALRDKRPILFPVLSGICFGLVFNTRPLTAAALVPTYGAFFVALLIANRAEWKDDLRKHAAWAAGGFLMLLAFALYNVGTTGNPLTGGYQAGSDLSQHVGFSGIHSVAIGIQNEQVQLSLFVMVFQSWPIWLGLSLVLLPFILGTRHLWDWFLLASGIFVMGIYTLYEAPGIMHGPRYWYEVVPFFVLLAARGADLLAIRLGEVAAALRKAIFRIDRPPAWAGVAVVYTCVVLFTILASRDWLTGNGGDWSIDKMPARSVELKGFNGANDRSLKAIEDADLENALVLAQGSSSWQSYGVLFWKNTIDLDGDVVYARDLPLRNQELFAKYPGRRVYFSDYQMGLLLPYGMTPSGVGASADLDTAPISDVIPTPTIVPTPTPDIAAAAIRDQRRREDLDALAGIARDYYANNTSYPPAANIQSICVYSFDSGCALKEVQDPLPTDPTPGKTYWLHSDGSTFFYFIALMEAPQAESVCPDPLPPEFGDRSLYHCVRGP